MEPYPTDGCLAAVAARHRRSGLREQSSWYASTRGAGSGISLVTFAGGPMYRNLRFAVIVAVACIAVGSPLLTHAQEVSVPVVPPLPRIPPLSPPLSPLLPPPSLPPDLPPASTPTPPAVVCEPGEPCHRALPKPEPAVRPCPQVNASGQPDCMPSPGTRSGPAASSAQLMRGSNAGDDRVHT